MEDTIITSTLFIFMWLLFNNLASIINCDVQNEIQTNPVAFHLICYTTVLFIFVMRPNPTLTFDQSIVVSIFVYLLFILMTRSRWYFVLPGLAMIGLYYIHKNYTTNKNDEPMDKDNHRSMDRLMIALFVMITIFGVHDYWRFEKSRLGNSFNTTKFFLANRPCPKQ